MFLTGKISQEIMKISREIAKISREIRPVFREISTVSNMFLNISHILIIKFIVTWKILFLFRLSWSTL
jgi:hypothetical protein